MRYLILFLLFPLCLLAQDPIDNTPDPTPDTGGLEGSEAAKTRLTIDGDLIIEGNLIVNGTILFPPSYTEPNPDPYPGNQSPWTWEAVEFVGIGGTRQIQRLWVDTWSYMTGRQNALFKDWTATNITFDANYLQFLNANHIDPIYINSLPLR